MSYYIGDTTVDPIPLAVPPEIDLDAFTIALAELSSPSGGITELAATIDAENGEVLVGPGIWFMSSGIYTLVVFLTNDSGGRAGLPAVRLVVESYYGGPWHSLASARAGWRDAPDNDVQLYTLLEVAKEQCLDYAPALGDDEDGDPIPVPFTWRQAQLMQARNIWNAAKSDPSTGGIGGEEFVFRPYPMDQTIRYILRPKRAIGAIG